MKTPDHHAFRLRMTAIVSIILLCGQESDAQSYMNLNFSNSTNKYSLITEVKSITFDGSGGIIVRKTDNSTTTETLTLLKSITLDGTSGGGSPLPVELVSFTVVPKRKGAEVRWSTGTETNNYGFEIERNRSGGGSGPTTVWTTAGFVEGNGTTAVQKEYQFIDRNLAAGEYRYRLKQIDRDGNVRFSAETGLTLTNVPEVFILEQNHPNPFNPVTSIGYRIPEAGAVTLTIFDAAGGRIETVVNETKEAGYHTTRFDGTSSATGTYFARLTFGGKSVTKKLMLVK